MSSRQEDDGKPNAPRGERSAGSAGHPEPATAAPASEAPGVAVPSAIVAAGGRTPTIDSSGTGPWHDNPDLVTWITQYNRDILYQFPRDCDSISMGGDERSKICIPGAGLSRNHHCMLTRRGNRIEVTDQVSRNGTYLQHSREPTFNVGAGDTWIVAKTVTLLAMNDEMHSQRPIFADILGATPGDNPSRTTTDDLLVAAIGGTNVLITGEWGCDHDRLARGIHTVSKRRRLPLEIANGLPTTTREQRKLIDRASRATLLLNLFTQPIDGDDSASNDAGEFDQEPESKDATAKTTKKDKPLKRKITPAESAFVSMLMSSSYNIRLIVMAPSTSTVAELLGPDAVPSMAHASLRPLCHRSGDMLHLLDRAFATIGSTVRVADMTQHSLGVLEAFAWPTNFKGLRLAAALLDMRARGISFEKAGEALRRGGSALHYWYGVSIGLHKHFLSSQADE